MKLAYVSAGHGGLAAYVQTVCQYLANSKHEVHVFSIEAEVKTEFKVDASNIHYHTHSLTHRGSYWLHRLKIKPFQLQERIGKFEYAHSVAHLALLVHQKHKLDLIEFPDFVFHPKLFSKLPYVYKMHGAAWIVKSYCQDRDVYSYEIKRQCVMLNSALKVFSPSYSVANFLTRSCQYNQAQIQTVPHAIDIEVFKPKSLNLQKPYQLMTVGRLEKRKGTHTLVRALLEVWRQEPNTHLYLYGGNGNFGQVEIELEIPPVIHQGRIHFMGFVPRETLIEAYQKAHVYVTPTRYETFGYTILEAMACGCPIIASDIGAVPELVIDEYNGWLVPRDDVDALAQTILDALQDKTKRVVYKEASRKLAEKFDVNKIMPRQLKLYQEAIDTYQGRA